jgi:hypothetical protein
MADRKDKKTSPQGRSTGKHPADTSPNPHGENKVIEMPIRTNQKRETTGENVAQTPNTVGGQLNPSVAHDLQPRAGVINQSPGARRQRNPAEPGDAKEAGKDAGKKEA